jgi:hypothetical protein
MRETKVHSIKHKTLAIEAPATDLIRRPVEALAEGQEPEASSVQSGDALSL